MSKLISLALALAKPLHQQKRLPPQKPLPAQKPLYWGRRFANGTIIGLLAVISIAPKSEAMNANSQPISLQQPAENLHAQIIFRIGNRGYTRSEERQYRRDLRMQQRREERRQYSRDGRYNRNGRYSRDGRYNRDAR